jgi:hypothetical protein
MSDTTLSGTISCIVSTDEYVISCSDIVISTLSSTTAKLKGALASKVQIENLNGNIQYRCRLNKDLNVSDVRELITTVIT